MIIDPNSIQLGSDAGMSSVAPTTDPWSGIDPRLVQLYQSHGVMNPGAAGSGFTDAAYWNNALNNQAGGDWNYINNRLGADLEGRGTDTPGSGDFGNKSGSQNSNSMFDQNNVFGSLLKMLFGGMNQNQNSAMPYNQYAGKIKPTGIMGYNGPQFQPTSTNGTMIGTTFAPTGMNSGQTQNQSQPSPGSGYRPRFSWMGMNNQSPMGAGSAFKPFSQYQQQSAQSQPLPNSNMTGM